jgi:hypothetical protein
MTEDKGTDRKIRGHRKIRGQEDKGTDEEIRGQIAQPPCEMLSIS